MYTIEHTSKREHIKHDSKREHVWRTHAERRTSSIECNVGTCQATVQIKHDHKLEEKEAFRVCECFQPACNVCQIKFGGASAGRLQMALEPANRGEHHSPQPESCHSSFSRSCLLFASPMLLGHAWKQMDGPHLLAATSGRRNPWPQHLLPHSTSHH